MRWKTYGRPAGKVEVFLNLGGKINQGIASFACYNSGLCLKTYASLSEDNLLRLEKLCHSLAKESAVADCRLGESLSDVLRRSIAYYRRVILLLIVYGTTLLL